jgi:hypothetical protein
MAKHIQNAEIALPNGKSWVIYADGYKRAAELLVEHIEDIYDINTVIFPILALYRQYVELSLKEIISYGQYLDNHNIKQGGHILSKLWASAKSYIKKHYSPLDNQKIKRAEDLINKLHEIDPTSEATRYPFVKSKRIGGIKRAPSFTFNEKPINLKELKNEINELGSLLHGISSYMAISQDLEAEFRHDCYGE